MNFGEAISINLVILALLISLLPTIASVAAVFVHLRARVLMNKKLDHITELTNSTLSAAHQRIAQLEAVVLKLTAKDHL